MSRGTRSRILHCLVGSYFLAIPRENFHMVDDFQLPWRRWCPGDFNLCAGVSSTRGKFTSRVPINQLVGMQQLHSDSSLIG